MSNLREDTIVLENITLLSYESASKYLHEKFDVSYDVTDEWIHFRNLISKYNDKGELHVPNGPLYYDKDTIENFDFENDPRFLSRHQMVPLSETDGNIISGLEAAAILRKKYSAANDNTIANMLNSLRAFTINKPDKKGMLSINSNMLERHENLFYSEQEVSCLIPSPDQQYIDFEQLIERDHFKNRNEDELVSFLKKKNQERELKTIDPVYHYPGSESISTYIGIDSRPVTVKEGRKPTGYYGYDAQQLIESKQAQFILSEIIAIEEATFVKPEERDPVKNSNLSITENLFHQECNRIKNGLATVPTNKEAFAKRIYAKGIKEKLYPKPMTVSRIMRHLSDLKYSGVTQSLKTLKTNSKTA